MAEQGFLARRWNHVVKEWRVILEAKGLFASAALLLVVGTAFVVWRATSALDEAEIAGLNATIKADEATIKFQDSRLKSALPIDHSNTSVPLPATGEVDFTNLRPLSNSTLIDQINKLSSSLREMEAAFESEETSIETVPYYNGQNSKEMEAHWNQMRKQEDQLHAQENYRWQTKYRGRVKAIYAELCRKLGILPVSETSLNSSQNIEEGEATSLLQTDMIAGMHPIAALADYLELSGATTALTLDII